MLIRSSVTVSLYTSETAVPLLPSSLARATMDTVPGATAVTLPLEETVATEVSVDSQVTPRLVPSSCL